MTTRTLRTSVLLLRGGGTDPVHADTVTFILMAKGLVEELKRPANASTNRGTKTDQQMRKKPPIDLCISAPAVIGDGLHHNLAPGMTLSADADKVT
jgi:hypothetical protein